MPPRAKKATAAAPTPTPVESMLVPDEADSVEPAAAVEPEPQTAEPPVAPGAPPVEPDPVPSVEPAEPELPVATWEPGEPCRICFPMGPIPSARAVGCEHGTWKLVEVTGG